MGKRRAGANHAGASAMGQYRRSRRASRWRGLGTAGLALAATASGWLGSTGARPWLIAVSVGVAGMAWRLRPEPDPDRWQRGAAGEVATARLLATLPRRFIVMHDRRLPGTRANIDHLVIGPTGVWVIDSKSFRAHLRVRRGRVMAGNHVVDTGPVIAQSNQLAARLDHPVAPVIAVHGVGLRRRGTMADGVRVVPARRLCHTLRKGPRPLSRSTVIAIICELNGVAPAAGTRR